MITLCTALASVTDNLSIHEDYLIILDNSRIFVPKAARSEVLQLLHRSHSGVTKTRLAARKLYFWPGINNDIALMVNNCQECQRLLPTQQQQPLVQTVAKFPMEQVGVDLFENGGHHYICMIDRFSTMPFCKRLKSLSTRAVLNHLQQWFLDWGFPVIIRSDNGPQFQCEFSEFCKENHIKHETSSPYFPQSNGHSESGVKICKQLLKKYDNNFLQFQHGLLEWRNIPNSSGYSPAEMFFSRRQRTQLPTLPQSFDTVDEEKVVSSCDQKRTRAKRGFDKHSVIIQPLVEGDLVLLQNPLSKRWDEKGIVKSSLNNGRSFVVELQSGKTTRRNQRFLRKLKC